MEEVSTELGSGDPPTSVSGCLWSVKGPHRTKDYFSLPPCAGTPPSALGCQTPWFSGQSSAHCRLEAWRHRRRTGSFHALVGTHSSREEGNKRSPGLHTWSVSQRMGQEATDLCMCQSGFQCLELQPGPPSQRAPC